MMLLLNKIFNSIFIIFNKLLTVIAIALLALILVVIYQDNGSVHITWQDYNIQLSLLALVIFICLLVVISYIKYSTNKSLYMKQKLFRYNNLIKRAKKLPYEQKEIILYIINKHAINHNIIVLNNKNYKTINDAITALLNNKSQAVKVHKKILKPIADWMQFQYLSDNTNDLNVNKLISSKLNYIYFETVCKQLLKSYKSNLEYIHKLANLMISNPNKIKKYNPRLVSIIMYYSANNLTGNKKNIQSKLLNYIISSTPDFIPAIHLKLTLLSPKEKIEFLYNLSKGDVLSIKYLKMLNLEDIKALKKYIDKKQDYKIKYISEYIKLMCVSEYRYTPNTETITTPDEQEVINFLLLINQLKQKDITTDTIINMQNNIYIDNLLWWKNYEDI